MFFFAPKAGLGVIDDENEFVVLGVLTSGVVSKPKIKTELGVQRKLSREKNEKKNKTKLHLFWVKMPCHFEKRSVHPKRVYVEILYPYRSKRAEPHGWWKLLNGKKINEMSTDRPTDRPTDVRSKTHYGPTSTTSTASQGIPCPIITLTLLVRLSLKTL